MIRKLSKAGLILFPLTGLFCFMGLVATQAFTDGVPADALERAVRYSHIYRAGAILSVLASIACLTAFSISARQRNRLK